MATPDDATPRDETTVTAGPLPPSALAPLTLDILKEVAASPDLRPAVLRVGATIHAWLRTMPAAPSCNGMAEMFGCPVVIDDMFDTGQWRFCDAEGRTIAEGRVGKPGDLVVYLPDRQMFAVVEIQEIDLGIWPAA